jgi:hypothetical protein
VIKPLDFGAEGITGSLDSNGCLIALNSYHPQHGYVTLTTAEPFPEDKRYDQAAVRAYRAGLANLVGFGFHFDSPVIERKTTLLESAIPYFELHFADGARAEVTTWASGGAAFQRWRILNANPYWGGDMALMQCAYTQLTEGGPVSSPQVEMHVRLSEELLTIENPCLAWAVAIVGLPVSGPMETRINGKANLRLAVDMPHEDIRLTYIFGPTADSAAEKVLTLHNDIEDNRRHWQIRWRSIPEDRLVRRGLLYGLMMAIPVEHTICILTDHMLLPLSWNRDAYYVARALLSWPSAQAADLVRRHLLWMFEQAERPDGLWGRCYLANGNLKDAAFQLDQQLFPLLELAEYVLVTGDQALFEHLQRHIDRLLQALLARQASGKMLFSTDETPADDPISLPYHFSSHVLFWRMLTLLDKLGVASVAEMAKSMRAEIDNAFIAQHNGQQLYAYATDGLGRFHFYHDANDLPVALMPAWGFVGVEDSVWRSTIAFAFSDQNPGVFNGHLGSIHTPTPWPLGDIQELIVAHSIGDTVRENRVRAHLANVAQWDDALPEAYDAATGEVTSRHWFAWPNAALACFELGACDT